MSQADIDKIEVVLPDYFQQVQLSMWLNEEQKCVGFSGTNQQTLEMLFIDPVYFRKGYGGEIIKKLIEQESIIFVDANKQNEGAVKFYQSQGFQVIGESKEDPQGNPHSRGHHPLHRRDSPPRAHCRGNAVPGDGGFPRRRRRG